MDEFESILLKFKFCKESAKTLDIWVEYRKPFKDGNQWFIVDLLCDMFVFYLQRAYDGTIWQCDDYADVFSETISKLGYDPYACMVEKLKEIASFKLDNGQAGFFSYEDAKNALIYHNSCYYAIDEYDDHFYAHALPQSGCIFPKWYRANYQNATNGERSERDLLQFMELVSNIEGGSS